MRHKTSTTKQSELHGSRRHHSVHMSGLCPAATALLAHVFKEPMLAASTVNEQICCKSLPVIFTSCSEVSWCCSKDYIHACSSKSCWMALLSTKARERLLWGAPGRGECSNIPCGTGGEIMSLSGLNLTKFALGGQLLAFRGHVFDTRHY